MIPLVFAFIICSFSPMQSKTFPTQDTYNDSIRQLIQIWGKKLAADHQNPTIMNKLAGLYFFLDKIDSAEIWLNISNQVDANNSENYFWKGRIYLKKGKIGIIPIEKLLTLIKQDNNSKAIRDFKKAIELRPDYFEAYYYLGAAHIAKGGKSHFEDAIKTYQYILDQDENFIDTQFQLGHAYHKSKQYDQAIETFNIYYNKHPEDGRPFIEMSHVYLETGDNEKACEYFMDGIVKLRDVKMLDKLFLEIMDIVTVDERNEYEQLNKNKKGVFFKKFWKSRDPTPLTGKNERFTEHFRRAQFARDTYLSIIPPFYDDRGRVYVKYGKPDNRYGSGSVSGDQVKDNESWSYELSIQKGLVFDFVQRGGMYNLVQDLTEAAPTGSGYEARLEIAGQLYSNRAGDLGGVYNRFSIDFNQSNLFEFITEKSLAVKAAPTEVYLHNYEATQLPFTIRFAQFRGKNNQTWLDIYRAVSAKDLNFNSNNNEFSANFTTTIVLSDSIFNEIERKVLPANIVLNSQQQIQSAISIDQTSMELSPENIYHLAVQVENSDGDKIGIKKFKLYIREFQSDSLQLSDIEMATKIEPSSNADQFYKDGLRVVPYIFNKFNINVPLHLYYEIYNLQIDNEGATNYQIDYKITSLKRNENMFKKLFRSIFGKSGQQSITSSYTREGNSKNIKEYISIDIKNMPTGINELSVIVKDLATNKSCSSTKQLDFFKIEGK